MNILIINCGSSSIKFSIFDIENNEQVLKSEINIFWHIFSTFLVKL